MQFAGSTEVQIKNIDDEIMFIITKPTAGLKKIKLFDPFEQDEDEREMVNEAGAIFGLVNLMIRNHFEKQYEI